MIIIIILKSVLSGMFHQLPEAKEGRNFSVFKAVVGSSFLASAFVLSGCDLSLNERNKIVAVEPLVCDLVVSLAPTESPVECLIDRLQDVHDYKITPQNLQSLNSAGQIFTLGREMTPGLKSWADSPATIVVGVSAIGQDQDAHDDHDEHSEGHGEEGDHHHHHHGGPDPHVWHDPQNIIEMSNIIVDSLKTNLVVSNQENINLLEDRHIAVKSILLDLDEWNEQQISTIPRRNRVIASKHDALGSYADRYGLETLTLLDYLGHSGSLSPETISSVLRFIRNNNIKILFTEQNPPSKLIVNLSEQTSLPLSSKPIYVDGLIPTGNIISTAVHNTCTIVNSLGGRCDVSSGEVLTARWESLVR